MPETGSIDKYTSDIGVVHDMNLFFPNKYPLSRYPSVHAGVRWFELICPALASFEGLLT